MQYSRVLRGSDKVLVQGFWVQAALQVRSVLGQDTSKSQPVKPREDMNNVSCCHVMTEILFKAA